MAILIPTKNIYHSDAPFAYDNRISGISYEPVNNVLNEQSGALTTVDATVSFKQNEVAKNEAFNAKITTQVTSQAVASYVAYKGHSFSQTDIVIPVIGENKSIKSVDTGVDGSGEPKISVSATFSVKRGKATALGSFTTTTAVEMGDIDYMFVERGDDTNAIPETAEIAYESTSAKATLSRGIENLKTVSAVRTTVNGEAVYRISGLTFLSRVIVVKMTYSGSSVAGFYNVPFSGEYEQYSLIGATITVNGVSVNVTQGNTEPVYVGEQGKKSVSVATANDFVQKGAVEYKSFSPKTDIYVEVPDLGSASVYYGSYSVDETGQFGSVDITVDPAEETTRVECKFSNYCQIAGIPMATISAGDAFEVYYADGTYSPFVSGRITYHESDDTLFISFNTSRADFVGFLFFGSASIPNVFSLCYADSLAKYKTGKECMTLKVSISDYYNEEGDLAISADGNGAPMCFNLNDEVIVMTKDGGEDKPISVADGGANKFTVIKRKLIYDGSVLQELSLQRV